MAAYLISVVFISSAAFYSHADPYFPNEIIEDDDDIGLAEQDEKEQDEHDQIAAYDASGCPKPPFRNFQCGVPKLKQCTHVPPNHNHTDIHSHPKLLDSKIIGGKPALYGEWPWVVAVVDNRWPKLPICTATMISQRWAVTVFDHCFYGKKSKAMTLEFGQHRLSDDKETYAVVKRGIEDLKKRCLHPSKLPSQCMVMLKFKKVEYSFSVLNICLPERNKGIENDKYGTYAMVAGWGFSEHYDEFSPKSEIQRELKVKIRKVFACKGMLIEKNCKDIADKLTSNFLCSGNRTTENPICKFDTGGGMFRYNLKNKWVLNAVACNIVTCELQQDVPAIYFRIAPYLNWIDSLLATTGEVNEYLEDADV